MAMAANYLDWIVSEIVPYIGKNVVEIGAGNGNVAKKLLSEKIETFLALEPSPNMFALLGRRTANARNCRPVQGFLGDVYRSYLAVFDTVLYINVLEHIKNPLQELSYARAVMKPDGYLVVFVPALEFLYSQWDRTIGHYRRYSKTVLKNLIHSGSFSIVCLKYFDMAGVLPWLLAFRILKRSIQKGQISLYDRLVVPIMRRLEQRLPPPIGKNLLLVARKK
jgi:SAM-dependent methyltransferase